MSAELDLTIALKVIYELSRGLKIIEKGHQYPSEYAKATLEEAGRIDGGLFHGGSSFIKWAEEVERINNIQ